METKILELDKFFEKDIIEFLDEKSAQKLGTGKTKATDQEYDLLVDSLRNNNTEKAASIIEETVNKFNSLDINNTYKRITFEELLEMIELLKKYVENNNNQTEINTILNLLEDSQEIKETLPEKISALEKLKVEKAQKKIEEREKEYQLQGKIEQEIKRISQDLFVNLRKKDLKESVANYKQLKEIFEKYPKGLEEEKQHFYNDLLAFFMQINRLKEELKQKESQAKGRDQETIQQNTKHEEGWQPQPENISKIINNSTEEIKKALEKGDFNSAKGHIIEMKQAATKIKDEKLRTIVEQKIDTMNNKIEFLKRNY